jgi:hypothetical protein
MILNRGSMRGQRAGYPILTLLSFYSLRSKSAKYRYLSLCSTSRFPTTAPVHTHCGTKHHLSDPPCRKLLSSARHPTSCRLSGGIFGSWRFERIWNTPLLLSLTTNLRRKVTKAMSRVCRTAPHLLKLTNYLDCSPWQCSPWPRTHRLPSLTLYWQDSLPTKLDCSWCVVIN